MRFIKTNIDNFGDVSSIIGYFGIYLYLYHYRSKYYGKLLKSCQLVCVGTTLCQW